MITEIEYLEAKKIVDAYNEQLNIPFVIVSDFCECEGEKEYHYAGGDKCQCCYKPFDNSKNN
tara:strand:- start:5246 stop:5431 length:186 start_codon:yes stop_codon:yes gene_type:complete